MSRPVPTPPPVAAAGPGDLVDVRVIGAPEAALLAAAALAALLQVDRSHGPYPSRKDPGLVRWYLTGRLDPAAGTAGCERAEWLGEALERLRGQLAAALADELADRQHALEQADASLGALLERWRSSAGHACRARASRGRAVR